MTDRAGMLAALAAAHEGDYDFDPEWDYTADDNRYLDALWPSFAAAWDEGGLWALTRRDGDRYSNPYRPSI